MARLSQIFRPRSKQSKHNAHNVANATESSINMDLANWDRMFKAAKKKGNKPEDDLFEGVANVFDKEGW